MNGGEGFDRKYKQQTKIKNKKKYVCKSRTYYKSIVTGNEWSHKGKKDQMVTSEMRVESGRK